VGVGVPVASLPRRVVGDDVALDGDALLLCGGRDASRAWDDMWLALPLRGAAGVLPRLRWVAVTPAAPPGAAVPGTHFGAAAAVVTPAGGHTRDAVLVLHGGCVAPFLHGAHGALAPDTDAGDVAAWGHGAVLRAGLALLSLHSLTWLPPPLQRNGAEVAARLLQGRMSHTLLPLPPARGVVPPGCAVLFGGECEEPQDNGAVLLQLAVVPGAATHLAATLTPVRDNAAYGGVLSVAPPAPTTPPPCTACDATRLATPHVPPPAHRVAAPRLPWMLRAAAVVCPPADAGDASGAAVRLLCVGGGGVAFAFGAHYSATALGTLRLPPPPSPSPSPSRSGVAAGTSAAVLAETAQALVGAGGDKPPNALLVAVRDAARLTTLLREAGELDGSRKATRTTSSAGTPLLLLPITAAAATGSSGGGGGGGAETTTSTAAAGAIAAAVARGEGVLVTATLADAWEERERKALLRHGCNPAKVAALQGDLAAALVRAGVEARQAAAIVEGATGVPPKVSFVGDILLLPPGALSHPALRTAIPDATLWPAVAAAFNAPRVARGAEISVDGMRTSRVIMLHGPPLPPTAFALPPLPAHGGDVAGGGGDAAAAAAPRPPADDSILLSREAAVAGVAALAPGRGGWVAVRENGITYHLDVTRTMFSAGNVSEKARMAAVAAGGETVVDLFAGIGYYTLPLLLHAGAAFVHACDWNADALTCLQLNLAANGVSPARFRVWPGDNRVTVAGPLRGVAHRVLLGLLPSSEAVWPLATTLLRPTGGTLHVHANVSDADLPAWRTALPARLRAAADAVGAPIAAAPYAVTLLHLQRVKSYAPHVWHVVADVALAPMSGAAMAVPAPA